jgi:hypothetical protein
MSRLPVPGQDSGEWGQILNDFLSVEHNGDGTLKAVGSLAAKADDVKVVHTTGNESVAGTKTFSSSPVVPAPSLGGHATTKTYVDNAVATSAAAAVPLSTVAAKGDLIVASAANTVTRVGVAADNTAVLVPSSGQASGVAWSTAPTVSGQFTAQTVGVTGAPGAVNPGRFAGVTTSGAPTSGTFTIGDYVIDKNGQMLVCVGSGTPGTWVHPRDGTNLLASGEETIPRDLATGFVSTASGFLYLSYGVFRKSETTTQIRLTTGTTAAGATPTLCRIGLYSIATNGAGTLVAATANDTALFAGAQTTYTRSWTASYAKVAGQRFALAVLVTTAATAPQLCGAAIVRGTEPGIAPRLAGYIATQTDLPASFVDASVTTTSSRVYGAILP